MDRGDDRVVRPGRTVGWAVILGRILRVCCWHEPQYEPDGIRQISGHDIQERGAAT